MLHKGWCSKVLVQASLAGRAAAGSVLNAGPHRGKCVKVLVQM